VSAPAQAARPPADTAARASGLTEAEAARRLAARGPSRPPATSRSYASIVRANVFTVFNAILAGFGTVTLVFGDWRDALFLGILVANASIGISQEVRAKRTLDRLALLVAPRATVIRDGARRAVGPEQLVVGDLVAVGAGDQVLADGRIAAAHDLHLDEAILTGESEPAARAHGDEIRSGAWVVEGAGSYEVTAVGHDSYASKLLGDARSFRHPRSPLELAVNRMLLFLVGLVVVLGGLLGYALWHRHAASGDAVATATAGVVSLVPEGLVVLVSLTFAVSALRMARRGVLAQQLNAIESLASADVVCLDKTGTLTDAALHVVEAIPAEGVEATELEQLLARAAASASLRNATVEALAERFALPQDAEPEEPLAEVPFASRRRWSAVQLADATVVLGAPERFELGALAAAAERERRHGRRVLAVARSAAPLSEGARAAGAVPATGRRPGDALANGAPGAGPEPEPGDEPPPDAQLAGLVVLAERLRPDARATVAFFAEQGVELKVLSGDNVQTAAAIAKDAGIEVRDVATGDALPRDPAELREVALRTTVFGRVAPQDKRRIVEALRDAGRYAAMVGDGVNDVPALKAARLAIAQGSGAQIAKGVADLVLVQGDFAAVPGLVAEGRRTLRNLQRVANLYATKSAFAAFLILTIGLTSTAYPLLPRHFSLAAALTIGIPTFFLALAPSQGDWRPERFGQRVARFAVPAGTLVGAGVVASYLFALHDLDERVIEARTVATTVLIAAGLYLVVALESQTRMRRNVVSAMCAALGGAYVAVLAIPSLRHFFGLVVPSPELVATAAVGAAISIGALVLAGFSVEPDR
jgi:cation-transporting P-type ATPase E